jgi:hypothetical protein
MFDSYGSLLISLLEYAGISRKIVGDGTASWAQSS